MAEHGNKTIDSIYELSTETHREQESAAKKCHLLFSYLSNSILKHVIMRFIYKDNSKKNKPIIFQCEAELITEADKLYKESTGKDIVKQPFVGCQILPA